MYKTACSLAVFLYLVSSCTNKGKEAVAKSIKGKWSQSHTHDNATRHDFIAYFKEDGTYDGIEDGKVAISGGTYRVNGDTIVLTDAICNPHAEGLYKIVHYDEDSLRFEVIRDSCTARREGTNMQGFKKMK